MLDITSSVKPPRTAFLDFPPGHTTGPPFDPSLQKAIVRDALGCLLVSRESGMIRRLPFVWPGGDAWKRSPLPERLARAETPQYQCEGDRHAAATHTDDTCPVCVLG